MSTKKGRNAQFELAKCTGKLEMYYSEIEDLYNLSLRATEPEAASAFSTRFMGFSDLWENFQTTVDIANDLNFEVSPDYKPNYTMLKDAGKFKWSILEAAKLLQKDTTDFASASAPAPTISTFKLPKITLPEFNGEITQWPAFIEKFDSIIHCNHTLDDLAKMHYLMGALQGRAREVCVGLTPIAANYPILLNALRAKYGNKRLLADTYFHQLLDLRPLIQESASGLSQLVVRFDTAFKSLQGLKLPNLANYFAAALLLTKLDPQTRREFETAPHEQIPSYDEIIDFLHRQTDALTRVKAKPPTLSKTREFHQQKTFVGQVHQQNRKPTTTRFSLCPVCTKPHQAFKCTTFAALTPGDRLQLAQEKGLCMNCLSDKHTIQACRSLLKCKQCQRPHHTLLHLSSSAGNSMPTNESPPEDPVPTVHFSTGTRMSYAPNVFSSQKVPIIPTAVVLVDTPLGRRKARFLVDSGSQRHLIGASFCKKFQIPVSQRPVPLEGLGNVAVRTLGETQFLIRSQYDTNVHFDISAVVVEKLTRRLPAETTDSGQFKFLQRLPLADRDFSRPGPIDGILGAQVFGKIILGSKLSSPDQSFQALKTSLGYIILGDATREFSADPPNSSSLSTFCLFDNQSLTRAVHRFWELEEVPKCSKPSAEERFCEDLFQKSTTRLNGSTYCVQLPFKEFPPSLGDSRQLAERRFHTLERKFKKNPQFYVQYATVIRDYLRQGHLTLISPSSKIPEHVCFIPHFAVVKESSSTPLRIVFDASAKTSNGRSLNDTLYTGPKLQRDIAQILLAFRSSAIALIADIRQMYRHISVDDKCRPFQRILWRDSPQAPIQTYELSCVVFGVTSAPYLALRTIQQLVHDEGKNFPLASDLTTNNMYVDDLIASLDSIHDALVAYQQLISLFQSGGFKLTKWASNSPEVVDTIPVEDRLVKPIDFSDKSQTRDPLKVLGMQWDPTSDLFIYKIPDFTPVYTKRGVLSVVARIWDPLGFLAPVILKAKLFVKALWDLQLDWDAEMPANFQDQWRVFLSQLQYLVKLRIPRFLGTRSHVTVSLIGFADSSEKGYGAVIYLKVEGTTPKVHLFYAKSRVAPKKTVTLPKLELCAAVLLAQIIQVSLETLGSKFSIVRVYALTDSTVTLAWIKNDQCKRETFVANRIPLIEKTVSPDQWYHVGTKDNMADCISRGLFPSELANYSAWNHGPHWLQDDPKNWPISPHPPDKTFDPSFTSETISSTVLAAFNPPKPDKTGFVEMIERFSSWKRLLRVTVYLLRFSKVLPQRSRIEPSDLGKAEHILIRQAQQEHFTNELRNLRLNKPLSDNIQRLSPFLDNDIIRVGGRLANSVLPYQTKHPILLPKTSHITKLIVNDYHVSNFHTGPNLVLSLVRQKYWIPSARNLVRQCTRQCNYCFRRRPTPTYPPMADLPAARVQEAKPFVQTGVDYAGPFQITLSRRRGVKSQKAYLCLFVCLVTKAIHLELASSLSTDAFLACLKRFMSRRGPVQCLFSDRGTNFIGAKAELDSIHAFLESEPFIEKWSTYLTDRKVTWKFNPPSAPHFGGLWEGNIRAVKTHLHKTIGNQILSYEEFNTVLVQIEALLNSRPLTILSSDPSEPEALTPAHFLTLTPLHHLPFSDTSKAATLRNRKSLLDSIVKTFWKRWSLEYLTSLQLKQKWYRSAKPLAPGTVVLIKNENTPPLTWPLGVVSEVHPGPDGQIRVATVRVGQSYYQRPAVKLCPLPSQ